MIIVYEFDRENFKISTTYYDVCVFCRFFFLKVRNPDLPVVWSKKIFFQFLLRVSVSQFLALSRAGKPNRLHVILSTFNINSHSDRYSINSFTIWHLPTELHSRYVEVRILVLKWNQCLELNRLAWIQCAYYLDMYILTFYIMSNINFCPIVTSVFGKVEKYPGIKIK